MPYAIDQEALESPNLKIMDIGKPPVKSIPYAAFPKALYLHPTDKTKEHRSRVVNNEAEMDAALKQGWRVKPHVPIEPPDPAIAAGEFEVAEQETRRGPGRPRSNPEAF